MRIREYLPFTSIQLNYQSYEARLLPATQHLVCQPGMTWTDRRGRKSATSIASLVTPTHRLRNPLRGRRIPPHPTVWQTLRESNDYPSTSPPPPHPRRPRHLCPSAPPPPPVGDRCPCSGSLIPGRQSGLKATPTTLLPRSKKLL